MFTQQLTDQVFQFIDDLKRERQKKQAASAKGRAINCMELEDRILLSATPLAPQALVNKNTADVQQTTATSPQSVAADASGNHVVVWSSHNQDGSGWGVYAQRFNSAGVAQGNEFKVNTQTTHDQKDIKVAMRSDGTFAVTWTDSNGEGTADVYARTYDANGNALQDHEFKVNESTDRDQKHSSVTINNNGVAVTWTSQKADGTWDLYERWFDTAGNAQSSETQINGTSSDSAIQSQVGMDPWGYVAVAWQCETGGTSDIYARYNGFTNGDSWDTGEFRVNETTGGNRYNPNMGFKTNDGSFVISWTSDGQDGSGAGIYARRYDVMGNALGGEFQVNTTTAGNQDYASVAIDNNTGNFVITWSSYNQDALGGWGIYSRSYNADGSPSSDETCVNSTVTGSQNYASAAYLSANSYVVTWSGDGVVDTSGVYSTIFQTSSGLVGQFSNDLFVGNPSLSGGDIGSPGVGGSTAFNGRTWTLGGSGTGIGGASDQFQFASEDFADNGDLFAKVTSISSMSAKAGLMFRNEASSDSAFAGVFHEGNTVSFEWRDSAGATVGTATVSDVNGPVWLHLNRSGNVFSAYYSYDNITWIQVGNDHTVGMHSIVKAGLAVTSGDNGATASAAFENVMVVDPRNFVLAGIDIGSPGQNGSLIGSNGSYAVIGGGSGIGGASDKFQFGANGLVGDWDLTAQIGDVDAGATAGVMFRNDRSADSMFVGVLLNPDHTLSLQWRDATGGTANASAAVAVNGPVWVRVTRVGNDFQGWYSADGTQWTQIGTTQTIAMNQTVLAGLAVTANDDAALHRVTFSHVAVSRQLSYSGDGSDIGNPDRNGSSTYTTGDSYVVTGSGTGIGGQTDQFHFSSSSFAGDGALVAHVSLPADAGAGAKAGLMFRNDRSTDDSRFADVVLASDGTVRFEWRDASGASAASVSLDGYQAGDPLWVKLTRTDNVFAGYYSTDGVTWTQIGAARTISMNATLDAGMAVCSGDAATLIAANFQHVAATHSADFAWHGADIGNPNRPGGEWATTGQTYVVSGGVSNTGDPDQFHLASTSFTGDGSLSAQVASWTNAQSGDQAGVMLRNDSTVDSPFAAVMVTTGNHVTFQWRDDSGSGSTSVDVNGLDSGNPVYVKLARAGSAVSGYYSLDGINWTQIGQTATVNLDATVQAGMAVSAHTGINQCVATFQQMKLSQAGEINLASADIGGPGLTGSTSYSDGVYTVVGSGNDISNTADQFQFASESVTGDAELVVRIESLTNTCDWAMNGLMLREDGSAGSRYAMISATPATSIQFQWRDTPSAGVGYTMHEYTFSGEDFSGPVWLKLTRHGNEFSGYYSDDGVNWTQVGKTQGIAMGQTVQAGLAVAAANNEALATATFSNLSISQTSDFAMSQSDIGSVVVSGSMTTPDEGYAIAGSGQDVAATNQHFHFTSESHTGDGEIIARVDSLTNAGYWTMGGVMFRNSADPSSTSVPFAMVFATPNYTDGSGNAGGVIFQWSHANGAWDCVRVALPQPNIPVWVKLARVENDFSGYYSTDGVTWTQIGGAQTVNINDTAQAGLYVCANTNDASAAAQFSHVSISQTSNLAWSDADVGGATVAGAGSTAYPDGHYLVYGGGYDAGVYNGNDGLVRNDQFQFSSDEFSGDLTLTARITSFSAATGWSKSGIMFRDSLDGNSMFADVVLTPSNGIQFQWRSGAEKDPVSASASFGGGPVWVKLVRSGDQFSGYYSTDNINWIQIGTTQTIVMHETIRGGLAVCAGDNGAIAHATFDNVSVTQTREAGDAGLTDVAFRRVDPTIDFNWGNEGSPGPGVGGANWSASWQGKFLADFSGNYTFAAGGDDGVRVWINDQLVIDAWYAQGFTYHYANLNLVAGQQYSIRMDYYNGVYGEAAQLWWAPPGQNWEVIPASHLSFVNAPPVNQTPTAQIAVTDTPLIFSTDLGNAIRVTDADACYGPLEVTLALTPGTGALSLSRTDGLQFVLGDGASDSSMTFIGTLENINAALDGMRFTPGAAYAGSLNLRITTNDMAPAFAGGSKSDTKTVTITVASANGFLATYYDNPNFTGTPIQAVNPTVDFNWNGTSPAAGIDASDWSARWLGWLQAPATGNYTFHATTASGVRLWINNQLVIDHATDGGEFDSLPITLTAGQSYLVRMEYLQSGSSGQAKLEWSSNGLPQQVISSDQVDHLDRTPFNSVPGDQTGRMNAPLVFSTANGNAITVGDPEFVNSASYVNVADGSFESPNIGAGGAYQYNVQGSAWTFDGTSGIVGNGSGFNNANAPAGSQSAFLQNSGAIWQDITFAEAGNYQIRFAAAYRPNFNGTNPIIVEIDGQRVGVITPTSADFRMYSTDPSYVTAGVHRLTFRGQNTSGEHTSFIDQVSPVDSNSLVRVTLALDHGAGTLSLSQTTGLSFSAGDGANDETMTFTGTMDDVNAALNGLQYLPATNATGTVSLHVTTTDLASPFPGGPNTVSSTVDITTSNLSDHAGLLATYYNWDSTAAPVYSVDPAVNINWNASGSPAPGIAGNNWNASWQGKILADYSETYTFHLTADDGARLWINGTLVVNAVNNQATNTFTGTIDLEAGQWYSIRVEYYQHSAGGALSLQWSSASQSQEVVPTSHLSCADVLAQQNAAPINNLPSQQVASLNTPLVFSGSNGNAISVSTPNVDQTNVTVPVGDANFEHYDVGIGWYANQYNPDDPGASWTFAGRSGLAGNGSGILLDNGSAPSGTQAAFLQYDSSIYQDVNFAQAGNYTISFMAAYRVYGGASPLSVYVDGVNVGTFTPDSAAFHGYQTNSFAVTAGTHRITFSHASSADQTTFIDQVSIAKTDSLVQVTVGLNNGAGTLSLSRTDGLMFLAGDGADDTTMTFSGTLADVNAALNGLRYMPTANYTGTFNLQFSSTHAGMVFSGGTLTDTDTVSVYVAVPSDSAGLLGLFYNGPGGATADSRDLARGKAGSASSQLDNYYAGYLTDGDAGTFAHTMNNADEWLQVDLGADTDLTQIRLTNRVDSCGDRLQHFTVFVLDSNNNVVWQQTDDSPTYNGEVFTFNTGLISGRYIKIQKNDSNFLHLGEVEVYNLSAPVPDVSRVDPTVEFDWGNQNTPAPGINGTNWSASWQGKILANYTETYTFYLTADDGVRLWVNDQLLIDSWQPQDATTHTATINLQAGQWYSFRMDYYQVAGDSGVKVEWSSDHQARGVIPSSQFTHANSAPVNSVPDGQTTDENTPLVFSTANGNAICVTDSDAVYGPLQVTLTVDHGGLTLNGATNLTFLVGDGTGDSTMTFYGSLADINAALEGLTYTPAATSGSYIPSATLQITTNDMAPALTGGAKTATSTVHIDITAPWQYNGLLGTYYSNADFTGTAYQRVDSGINFEWGYSNPSPMPGIGPNNWSARWQGTITADNTETYTFYVSGDDGFRLYVNNQLLIDRTDNHSRDITYSATIDLVAGQAYSFRLDYRQDWSEAAIKVEWSSASQVREVICADHFRTADQTPAITAPNAQNGIGTQPIVFSESLGTVIAVNELHNSGPLTVTLTASQGSLTLSRLDGLTFTDGDGADDLTMTFSGSVADINAALSGLRYTRATGETGPATLQITATDPGTPTGARTSSTTVQIGAVQPQAAGLLATFYSDTNLEIPVAARIDSAINFDWGLETSPAPGVQGTNWSASWQGFIQVPESGYYAFYATTDDGVRLFVNNRLLMDYFGAQVATHSASIYLEAGQQYSICMKYNQFGGWENAKLEWSHGTSPRELIPTSAFSHAIQAPVNYLPASQTVNEDSSLVFSVANGNAISIVDVDAQTSQLSVTLTATNGAITLGDTAGLYFSAGDGTSDSTMTFTGNLADINAALNGLRFAPSAGFHGAAALRVTTTDTVTSLSTCNTLSISVLSVNHAPVNSVPGSQNVYEHQTVIFSAANGNAITVTDPDIDWASSSVAVRNSSFESPNIGTGGTAYQYGVLGADWIFSGTSGIAANGSGFGNANAAAGTQVAFIQNGGAISQDVTFTETGMYTIGFEAAFRNAGAGMNPVFVEVDGVTYGCATPNSTSFQSFRTAAFPITAGTHRITFRGLNPGGDRMTFLDRVSISKSQNLLQVTVSADIGKLNLGSTLGVVITQGSAQNSNAITFTGSVQDVNAALEGLQYVPLAGYEGTDTLRITTNDLGNVGVGGPMSSTRTITINTIAVNDPPAVTAPGSQGTYINHSIVFTGGNRNGISIDDPDLDASNAAAVVNDGSFESPYVGTGWGAYLQNGVPGSAWTFTPVNWTEINTTGKINLSGIAGNGSAYEHPDAPAGGQVAFVQGTGTIWQDIIFPKTGDYSISFLAAYRIYHTGSTPINPILVQVDGVTVGTISPQTSSFQAYHTNAFSVTAGIHRVSFSGTIVQSADVTSYLDQVAISPANTTSSQVQVTLAVQHGALSLSGTQGLTFVSGDGAGDATMTFRGVLADINAALGGLRYDPVNGYVGSDAIQITVNDLGNRGVGGPQTTVRTVAIDIAGGPVVNSTTQGVQQTLPESPQAVAADANGNYVVVWSSQDQDGDGWSVYARQFNAAGIAQGNEFQVNTNTAGSQTYAAVAMNADGSFVVTWSSQNQDGDGWGVYAQRFDSFGNAVGGEFQVNVNTASDQMYSSVAINANGDFAVTWSSKNQSNGNWDVFARVFRANGDATDEFRVNTGTSGDQMYSRIAMDANGAFTIVWQSQASGDWDIYARRYGADGAALGDQFRVNDATAGDQHNASIGMDSSGRFVVSWTSDGQDGSGGGIYARQFNADGTTAPVYTVTGGGGNIYGTSDQFHFTSQEVTGNGEIVARVDSMTDTSWAAKAGIMYRNDNSAGATYASVFVTPQSNNHLVYFEWRSTDGAMGNYVQTVDAGCLPVWLKLTRTGNSFSAFYSTDGQSWTQLGTAQPVTMNNTARAGMVVVSCDESKLCTATFRNVAINNNTSLSFSDADIGAPVLAGGSSMGEFLVNDTTAGDQDYSAVAMDRRGNFFVTWTTDDQNVFGRRFNEDGTAIGSETRINGTTDGAQGYSSVTSLSPKDFLVVWSGSAPGDTAGVFQAEQSPPGLVASYFNSADFNGSPIQRIDSSIDFDYGYAGRPFGDFNVNDWSVRWEGLIKVDTNETYTFYVDGANSAKLWINGQQVITTGTSGSINLVAGQWYSFRMDYHQTDGWKTAKLQWSSNTIARQLVSSSHFTYENPAPVNNLPLASQSTNEDNSLVFSTANGNAIQINDLDVNGDDLEVSLSVSHGTLTLSGVSGLTFLRGTGAGDIAMTFRGTMADINAALNGLAFDPASNYNGLANLQITTNDLGSTGMGGAKVTTSNLAVHVTAVNDAPVNTVPGAHHVFEHDTLVFSNATGNPISISDVDAGSNPVRVTLSVDHGTLTLSGAAGLTFVSGSGANASTLTVVGTISDINAALDGLQFNPDRNYDGVATLRILTNDQGNAGLGGSLTAESTVAIAVTAVNDAPEITAPNYQEPYTQFAYEFSNSSGNRISIADPDSANPVVRVTLSVEHGTLTLGRHDGLTLRSGFGTNDAQVTMEGTVADINAALDGMLFKAADRFEGTAHLQIDVNDLGNTGVGGEQTASRTVTLNVVRANMPPVNTVPGAQQVLEHHTVTFDSIYGNGIRVDDPDAGDAELVVTLSANHGTLTLGSAEGLHFLSGSRINSTSVSFRGTLANINHALEGLQFAPANNYDGPATITIHTDDQGNSGAGGAKTATNTIAIHVTSVNDPPTVVVPVAQDMLEHETRVFSQANGNAIRVGDPDAGEAPIQVTLRVDSGTLTLSSVRGLTFAQGSGPRGSAMTFTGKIADLNAALDGMTYECGSLLHDLADNLRVTVNDLGNSGTIATPLTVARDVHISVTAVNDAPTVAVPHNLGGDPTQMKFSSAGGNPIIIGDPESGITNDPLMVRIETRYGTFSLASTAGLTIQGIPVHSNLVVLTGTVTDINRALDGLIFMNSSLDAAMQITVNDLSRNSGIGGPKDTVVQIFARSVLDPNFKPGSNDLHFQQATGVLTQPSAVAVQELLHNAQLQAKLPTLEQGANAPLFLSNAGQIGNSHSVDAGIQHGVEHVVGNGNGKIAEDTFDVRDAKALEEAKFAADTASAPEPVQLGTTSHRDENLLVGLGIVSAGYIAWAFNGGSLLAGAISATPMWKPFDPLAVLDFNDRAAKGAAGLTGEDNLQSLLG